ncbi:MAG: hypothetical protein J6D34_06375 [Atopobiaceae bacterium]|nr:hypothetical protein [Atopobiaceae bacterium]
MRTPSYEQAFEVLCLLAADEGRGEVLFGDSLERARVLVPPFMVGEKFPDVYLEFPLAGDPFLDVTVLLHDPVRGTRIDSPAAGNTGPMIDWFADACRTYPNISCGYELDTKKPQLAQAAVHFQPRKDIELVEPFCKVIGEPERASLYLDLARRMPQGWPLSFFGLFRGRPGSPLRVCGYMDYNEQAACRDNPDRLRSAFDAIGFSHYDDAMIEQVHALLAVAPDTVDFQFDLYEDGTLGSTFAIDVQFAIERPERVRSSFAEGPTSRVMHLFEEWGIADKRWRLGAEAAFARSIPVELDDGSAGRFAFTLMPQWVKARWTDKALQPSKLYMLGSAGLL